MELPRRHADDVYVPIGGYRQLVGELQNAASAHAWPIVLVSAFDQRTRVMPFRAVDRKVVPCGVRSITASLLECGFQNVRTVLQQWNPRFLPATAVEGGHPIDILLISSMAIHAEAAYQLIKDAHRLGKNRPLIVLGGPKAIYEPEDGFAISEDLVGQGIDLAVTGEEYVLLDFLRTLTDQTSSHETPLEGFERARRTGALNTVPGLVYRAPESQLDVPCLLNTGIQRLVRDLDSLPMPLAGLTRIEPVHRRRTLSSRAMTAAEVRKRAFIATLVTTHGCRFHCDFCPIPAYQQRTWRYKNPQRIVDEIRQLGEELNYRYFFGTDDNFFNDRGSVEEILTAMAGGTIHGKPFGKAIHFLTEATEFDVCKNRDLLPLARSAGLKTIYFGIEDLNAQLINKGQTLNKTEDLFRELHRHEMEGYAMMIHHDDQPLFSREPKRLGVVNQAYKLYKMGAVGYHSTYITPAQGAKNLERMYNSGEVISHVAGQRVPESYFDGNHVVASRHQRVWIRQMQLWAAYLAFYNPLHFLQSCLRNLKNVHNRRLFKWQILGGAMIPMSILKEIPYVLATAFGKQERHMAPPRRCLPMYDVHTGERIRWGVDSDSTVSAPDRLEPSTETIATPNHSQSSLQLPVIS